MVPVCSKTRSLTATTSRRMSSEVADDPATKKLACFSDTATSPTLIPFSPSESMISPAVADRFLKTLPALNVPPGWLSRRHRVIRRSSARPVSTSPGRDRNVAANTSRVEVTFECRYDNSRSSGPNRPMIPSLRSTIEAHEAVSCLRAEAPRALTHRSAYRAGNTDEELEPGQTGLHAASCHLCQGAAPPARTSVPSTSTRPNEGPRRITSPSNPTRRPPGSSPGPGRAPACRR